MEQYLTKILSQDISRIVTAKLIEHRGKEEKTEKLKM